jgi:hypothetical protein
MHNRNIFSLKKQSPFRKKDSIEHRSFLIPSASMLISKLKRFFYEIKRLILRVLKLIKLSFERMNEAYSRDALNCLGYSTDQKTVKRPSESLFTQKEHQNAPL